MEVSVTVDGNAELKIFPVAACVPETTPVPLIPLVISQNLAALSDHHALQHDFH